MVQQEQYPNLNNIVTNVLMNFQDIVAYIIDLMPTYIR